MRRGALQVGGDADVVLVKLIRIATAPLRAKQFRVMSPYDGIELPFRVVETYYEGNLRGRRWSRACGAGQGRFVSPIHAH